MLVTTIDGLLKNSLVNFAIDKGNNDMLKSLASNEYKVIENIEDNMNFDVEITLCDGTFITSESGLATPKDIDEYCLANDGIDLITTLENWFDHKWLHEHELEIINDATIYNTYIGVLTYGDWLYNYIARNY